jgi:hypothetical protein
MALQTDASLSLRTRQASIVIVVSVVGWMAGLWFGGRLGLPPRFAFLLDLACMAALIWSMVVLLRVWRARQEMKD